MGLSVKDWSKSARETFPKAEWVTISAHWTYAHGHSDYGRWDLSIGGMPGLKQPCESFSGSSPQACIDAALAKLAGKPAVEDGEGE